MTRMVSGGPGGSIRIRKRKDTVSENGEPTGEQEEVEVLAVVHKHLTIWEAAKAFFDREHLVDVESITAIVETIAVVSALSIGIILATLFVADRSAFEDADKFTYPTFTPTTETVSELASMGLPSARALQFSFLSLSFAIGAFGGSLLLIFSAKEAGFRPDLMEETDAEARLDEITRLLHVNTWYRFFRWLILLLLLATALSLFLLFWATNIYVNFMFPHYGTHTEKGNTMTTYTNGAFNYSFGGWFIVALAVYTVVAHIYVYYKALANGYMLEVTDLKDLLEERQDHVVFTNWRVLKSRRSMDRMVVKADKLRKRKENVLELHQQLDRVLAGNRLDAGDEEEFQQNFVRIEREELKKQHRELKQLEKDLHEAEKALRVKEMKLRDRLRKKEYSFATKTHKKRPTRQTSSATALTGRPSSRVTPSSTAQAFEDLGSVPGTAESSLN